MFMNPLELKKHKTKIYIHKKRIDLLNSILMNKYSLSSTLAKSYSKFLFLLETVYEINHQFVFTNDNFYHKGFTHTPCAKCLKFLKDNNIITVHTPLVKNYKYDIVRRDKSTFVSLNLDFPEDMYSGSLVKLEYEKITQELRTLLQNTPNKDVNNYSLNLNKYSEYSEEAFCNRYADLTYVDLLGNVDLDITMKLKQPAHHTSKSPYRYYHYFHSIPKENRCRLRLDGEELVELFDIHNCMLLMVNFLLPKPDERFENLTLSGKIYETIRDWVNCSYGTNWDRDFAKNSANKYLNISNWKLDRAEKSTHSANQDAYYVSQYFYNNHKIVYNYIRQTHSCTSKEVYRNFTKNLEKWESFVIVTNIIKELWNDYDVKAISLHDSVWCKKTDYSKIVNKYSEKETIKTLIITKNFRQYEKKSKRTRDYIEQRNCHTPRKRIDS